MFSIMGSGLSVPVLWLFCTGMAYVCPKWQARERIFRLTDLPSGSIQTKQDVRAVIGWIRECRSHVPKEDLCAVVHGLRMRNSQFLPGKRKKPELSGEATREAA